MRLPWVARVVWDTDKELDLVDDKGNPDHGKALTTIVILWVLILVTIGRTPVVGLVVTLLAAAFGARVFIAFLRSKTVTSTEQVVFREHGANTEEIPVDVSKLPTGL